MIGVPERRVNDVGGLDGGPIDIRDHGVTLFEKRVDAMLVLLTSPDIAAFKVDALRRAIEINGPESYASRSYYEKWLHAICDLLIEQGVVSRHELDLRIAALAASETEEGA